MGSPVLSPCFFMMASVKRSLFSVTDRRYSAFGKPKRDDILLGTACPPLSEGKVVLPRSPFITMAFDLDLHVGMLHQQGTILFQHLRILRTNVIFIKVEIDVLEQPAFKNRPFDPWCFLGH